MPIDRTQFPCWTCSAEQAQDVRAWLNACSDVNVENQRSPLSGWPLGCCRVKQVGVVRASDTTRATT
jgi:hypothetical protein